MMGSENRRMSIIKALRKRRLDRYLTWHPANMTYTGMYDNLHQYSKNKIHCSCPLCNTKTRNKSRRSRGSKARNNFCPSINYKISDLRKIQKLEYQDE